MSMIDDLLAFEDDPESRFSVLVRNASSSSYSSSGPKKSTVADEEIRRIREKAEEERLNSLKQFQELMSEMKEPDGADEWQHLSPEEREKIERARRTMLQ